MTSSDVALATPPRPVAARPPAAAAAAALAPRRHRVTAVAVVHTPTRMWSRFDAVGEIDIELGSTTTPQTARRRDHDPAAVFDYESGGDDFGDDEDAADVPVAVVGPPRLRRVIGGATRRALEF